MAELDRRDFLKVVGLSAGAAAAAGCKDPVEKVIPYLNQPEEIVPGIPTYYASTCRECPNACGIQVKTREGRPIKVDGNPDDPITRGSLCVRGQASLWRTFESTRVTGPLRREGDRLVPTTWEEAIAQVVEQVRPQLGTGGVAFLGGLETGTLDKLIDQFLGALGTRNRVRFELYASEALRSANRAVFGTPAVPRFDLERADVIVSFGADFVETWLNPVENQRGFADARRDGKGWSVWVGPRLSVSGANTDQWLAPVPGTEILVSLALAQAVASIRRVDMGAVAGVLRRFTPAIVAERTGIPRERIDELAERIAAAKAPVALPPGNELQGDNATAFAAAVQLLNVASGAVGNTVRFGPDHNLGSLDRFADVKELAGKMRSGEVKVLFVHDANPVYAVPAAFGFADALDKVDFVVSFASALDETSSRADLVLPDHTPYESWSDAEPVVGVRRLQQPTVRPLHDSRATGDVLLEIGRALGASDLPAGSFRDAVVAPWGAGLDAALAKGGAFEPAANRAVSLSSRVADLDFETAEISGRGELTLLTYPSLHFYDGRSARIPRLQEIPDPVTKTMWGSVAELHPETAARLGLATGDVVKLATEAGDLELPVFVHSALRPDVVAVAVGQGHQPLEPDIDLAQRWGSRDWLGRKTVYGANVLSILPGRLDAASGALAWLSAHATLEATGQKKLLPNSQPTFDQEDRGFAQATTLAALLGEEEAHSDAPHLETREYDPAGDAAPDSPYRWGMSIDLDACAGCNACMAACAQENNIPTVGPEIAVRGREMHWIRIERYVEEHAGQLDVRHSPGLCQHCGAAPCENVCPVYATYHNPDGLNVMVYNRCIGTRYCSNNCPYKVRRFNYLPYDFEVREPEGLMLNPDVTVRSKGVMEKCSFCVQRIQYAKREAKHENRVLSDGEVTPACAQACPSQAIVFGNLRDPNSRVAKLREDKRAYQALDHLHTRPAVSYRRVIRRVSSPDNGPGDHGSHG